MHLVLNRSLLLASAASTALLIVAQPAVAEDSNKFGDGSYQVADSSQVALNSRGAGAREVVTVTARHREEKAQAVPISIDVLGAAQIEKAGEYTLQQLQISVPTLFATTYNARNANINIRGLGSNTSTTNDGLENGVGFYIDQVYYGRVGLSQFDLLDLEQVEVLHGPQGTLFGKNTTAGAINITTRKPTFTPEARLQLSGGDFGYYQAQAAVSGPLLDDKIAGRISFGKTKRGGFVNNVTTGKDLFDYDNTTARGQLLADVSDDLEFRLIADYSRQRRNCCVGVIDGVITTFDNGSAISDNFYQKSARFGYTPATTNAFQRKTDANSPIQANMEAWGVSLIGDWKLGGGTLTSVTAYREWNFNPKNDCDATKLSLIVLCQTTDHQKQWSQELRYASAVGESFDYQVGLYYFWQIVDGYALTGYGSDAPLWYLGVSTPLYQAALSGYTTAATTTPETSSYAAFGQANWHITPSLTVTGGLRYTYEDKKGDYSNTVIAATDLSSFSAAQQAAAVALRGAYSRPLTYSAALHSGSVSGLATVSYQINEQFLGYVTYSHGEKSGGLNMALLPATVTNPRVKPEVVDAYEIGLKSQFPELALTLNLAAFWSDVGDYQTQIVDTNPPYPAYIANIPGVRSRGFELNFDWSALNWLSFGGGASYTDAVYRSYTNGPAAPELGPSSVYHYADLSGRPLASAPKWVFTFRADASHSLGVAAPAGLGTLEGYIHADTRYQTSNYTAVNDSRYSLAKAYDLTNLRLGIRTEGERWDIGLFANNVFNQRYYLSRSLATTGQLSGTPGDPRTAGITLKIKY